MLNETDELIVLRESNGGDEGDEEAKEAEMSHNRNNFASRVQKMLTNDGSDTIAKSRGHSKSVSHQRTEIETLRSEEVRVESEEDSYNAD